MFSTDLFIDISYENEKLMRDSTVEDAGISELGAQYQICGLRLF